MAVLATVLVLAGCGSPEHATPRSALVRTTHPATHSAAVGSVVGGPSEIPWWSHGRLHLQEGVIGTALRQIVWRNGTVLAGRTTSRGSRWSILRGDQLVPLVTSSTPYVEPVPSANGLHVAWTTETTLAKVNLYTRIARFSVHAYDVRSGSSRTTTLDSRVTCCDASGSITVAGVDNDGTVLLSRAADRVWSWRPGHPPLVAHGSVHLRALDGLDLWPGGVSWLTSGDSAGPAAYGTVSRRGRVVLRGSVDQAWEGLWSPDGSAYVYPVFQKTGGSSPVLVRGSGRTTRLAVHGRVIVVGWETPTSVILATRARGAGDVLRSVQPVRCDVTNGDCVDAGPVLRRVVLARPRG